MGVLAEMEVELICDRHPVVRGVKGDAEGGVWWDEVRGVILFCFSE